MTVRQPLFNENDTTDQTATELRLWLKDYVNQRPGLIQGSAFEVTQRGSGANFSVDIQPGSLVLPGTEDANHGYYFVDNDYVYNMECPSNADPTNPRIDTIVVRARDQSFASGDPGTNNYNDAIFTWVTGTPAASPSPPSLASLANYFKLADVSIPAGSTVITSGNITDLRTSPVTTTQGYASGVGCIVTCTSATRPSLPRTGQVIWESDTKRLVINEGTAAAPSWVVYGVSGVSQWKNYTATFPITGTNTKYGRYLQIGSIVIGVVGFKLGTSGNVSQNMYCTLPIPVTDPGVTGIVYLGGGRAFNSTGLFQGVYYSCTARILPNATQMNLFAVGGSPIWGALQPFDWGSGSDIYQRADHMSMLFCYEVSG